MRDNKAVSGAHVQAVSENNGRVVAGVISDSDGTFTIEGLDLNDAYYLYTRPLQGKTASILLLLPTQNRIFVRKKKFIQGVFFNPASEEEKGYPYGISLSR